MFSLVVCGLFLANEIYAVCNAPLNAQNNADRLSFIDGLGITVESNQPQSKMVVIPEIFYEVYTGYNALQKAAGYDLSVYKGCEVTIYSYNIAPPQNYTGESVVNLIVYKDKIIGGDISSTALGGYMLPLKQVIT